MLVLPPSYCPISCHPQTSAILISQKPMTFFILKQGQQGSASPTAFLNDPVRLVRCCSSSSGRALISALFMIWDIFVPSIYIEHVRMWPWEKMSTHFIWRQINLLGEAWWKQALTPINSTRLEASLCGPFSRSRGDYSIMLCCRASNVASQFKMLL